MQLRSLHKTQQIPSPDDISLPRDPLTATPRSPGVFRGAVPSQGWSLPRTQGTDGLNLHLHHRMVPFHLAALTILFPQPTGGGGEPGHRPRSQEGEPNETVCGKASARALRLNSSHLSPCTVVSGGSQRTVQSLTWNNLRCQRRSPGSAPRDPLNKTTSVLCHLLAWLFGR